MWNRSENQIKLVIIRHGVTPSNKEHRYIGKTEESLSVEGRDRLAEEKERNRYPAVDCLFSSPMKRCRETAALLYPKAEAVLIPEWEEMDFGAFEGKNYKELSGDLRYQAWIDSNGTLPFPEGESREEFVLRCKQGFCRMLPLLTALAEKEQKPMITAGMIVHGGTIMSLLSSYYGGDYFDYQAANGGGYTCTLKNDCGRFRIADLEKL